MYIYQGKPESRTLIIDTYSSIKYLNNLMTPDSGSITKWEYNINLEKEPKPENIDVDWIVQEKNGKKE